MLSNLKEWFFKFITSRFLIMFLFVFLFAGILIYRLFDLQIVNGERYQNEFKLSIRKERSIPSTRGNIYDADGNLLAYNELAYQVTIEDVYESGSDKNSRLNTTLDKLIDIIEKHGDSINIDFNIILDEDGNYVYSVIGTSLLRFLADIYGHSNINDLTYAEKTATPDEVIDYLAGTTRFGIGEYRLDENGEYIRDENNKRIFDIGKDLSKERILQIAIIRYTMSLNSFQKYIPVVVAGPVSDETIAAVMENSDILEGVSIEETTVRKYVDSVYFSNIIGYTGKISLEEIKAFEEQGIIYSGNDIIGKNGIEQSMETYLQGTKGSEVVYVDNMGKVIEITERVLPESGNDIHLTIKKDLQEAVYHILEQKIAGILVSKIRNIKEYIPEEGASASKIVIPIYDVYFALFDNNVLKMKDFNHENSSETESVVYANFVDYKDNVLEKLRNELLTKKTKYKNLKDEYKTYESYIVTALSSENVGVLCSDLIDTKDETYLAWRNDESISLCEYLMHAISMNWIDVQNLTLDNQYADTDEIYEVLVDYIIDYLDNNTEFGKKIIKYMIKNGKLTGKQVCQLLIDRGLVILTDSEVSSFQKGKVSPYNFMLERIKNLDITPAQLALDPCTGDIVITDSKTGNTLAMVSYPGYDANKIYEPGYWVKINTDKSYPMLNFTTQRRTAPGSTFKMVTSAAILEEGYLNTKQTVTCTGIFERLTSRNKCWIYPGSHGNQNVTGAIKNSCNCFFYEMGYRMSLVDGEYVDSKGLETLAEYADIFGLSEPSGVEISEYQPKVSDEYPIISAIGQGSANYTTSQLARYVTTIANRGTCYNLTLIDKIFDSSGKVVLDNHANIRNQVDFADSTWDAIQLGMKQVVESKSYFRELNLSVAGKTGTAQESKLRPNHALFVCYAPYERPEIAISTRIEYGYSSDYAAETTRDVLKYYFELESEEELLDGKAASMDAAGTNTD